MIIQDPMPIFFRIHSPATVTQNSIHQFFWGDFRALMIQKRRRIFVFRFMVIDGLNCHCERY